MINSVKKYIRRYGWSLVPLGANSKLPVRRNWGEDVITSDMLAESYYQSNPDHGVGVALGPSRLCSLDIDHDESFRIICDAMNIDLDALIADHPTINGRGLRIMFSIPEGVDLPYQRMNWRPESDPTGEKHRELSAQARDKKKQAEKATDETERSKLLEEEKELRELAREYAMFTVFELRAVDGSQQRFDVLPPSIHPDTGRPYEWITEPGAKIPEVPGWLLDIWQKFETNYRRQFQAACPWAVIEEIYKKESKSEPTPRQHCSDGGLVMVANEYARTIDIIDELSRHGYKISSDRRRALSPYSSTGLPGVAIFKDSNKCWNHHASDPLCSDATGRPVSSFDLYCEYEHGGKFVEAAKSAAKKLGIRTDAPARASQSEATGYVVSAPSGTQLSAETKERHDQTAVIDIATPLPWTDEKGKPLALIENLAEIIHRLGGEARYNVMTKAQELVFPGPEVLIDNRANYNLTHLISMCSLFKMQTGTVPEFVANLAARNPYSPVIEWVKSKPWDGVDRMPEFLKTVRAKDEDLKNTLITRWMISAVAAAFDPDGIAAQGILVFQGAQGSGKTTWFKNLVPAEVNKAACMVRDGVILRLDDKDSVKQACSHWLVELGEIDSSFRKSDHAALKAFITSNQDVMRLPYARAESVMPRRTVFFGSVNQSDYLVDDTGNRRFWTVECQSIKAMHDIDMQQVWAQVHQSMYLAGISYHLSADELDRLNKGNEARLVTCHVADAIHTELDWDAPQSSWAWLSSRQVCELAGIDRPTQADCRKARAAILRANGGQERRTSRNNEHLTPPSKPASF